MVNFSGRAYPASEVTLLKDGQIVVISTAGPDANFSMSLSGLSAGNYNFLIYSEDKKGRRSSLFSFPTYIAYGATTNISGIFLAPTIAVDKSEVKYGDNLTILGQSVPDATVTININSEQELFRYITTDEDGAYLYNFDTSLLVKGDHLVRAKSLADSEISPYGRSLGFIVGERNVLAKESSSGLITGKGDFNSDDKINLIDFSIAAYWYKRPAPPSHVDLNSDNKVDLIDFSIMAYHWTG